MSHRACQFTLKPALLWLLILFLAACQPTVSPTTLKIGLIAPFEGEDRALGYEMLYAVKIALQERNQQGGIQGYPIELVALNDFNDPDEAISQARALLADPDILGVVGHASSPTTLAALPIYQQGQLAVSIPWSIDPPDPALVGVVSVAATRAETHAYLTQYQQEQGFTQTQLITKLSLIQPNSAALQLDTSAIRAGAILTQLPPHLSVFGQVDSASSQLIQVAGQAANGFIYVSPASDVPLDTPFAHAYHTLTGSTPTPRALLAYDATHILLDSLETAITINGTLTRATVQTTIRQITRLGLSGEIAFDEYGHRRQAPIGLYQISQARYPGVKVTP